jgi:tRNA pseudouridine32 synthase/23S rRNA pseudouridine746 synthase
MLFGLGFKSAFRLVFMSDVFDDLAVLPKCMEELEILQRDPSFLLINKPTRLLSVPGRHPQNRDSVIARLLVDLPNAAIVHRLDFDTSGIMVIPLNKVALSHISKQFQARTTHKTYTAIVNGLVKDNSGVIDLPIAPDMEHRPKYKICAATGRQSVTEFTVVSRDEIAQTSRVLLHPITGRSHQLRLHMLAIGHPILGCEFYADEAALSKSPRLLLHATELEFDHPVTGARVLGVCNPGF